MTCVALSGCTLLTFDPPPVDTPAPAVVLTATDTSIIQAAVAAQFSGQPVQFGKMLPGTKYKETDSITVCGQAETGSGATTYYIGYLSRERSEFAVAATGSAGKERQTVIGACMKAGADTTVIIYPTAT